MQINKYPSLTIGVVTHQRAVALTKLLLNLKLAINAYPGACELLIANNSGVETRVYITEIVENVGIETVCDLRILDSEENNISVGRNLILNSASFHHIAFIDDDEYPIDTWLIELVDAMAKFDCELIAGPIVPVFPVRTLRWIKRVDLHNIRSVSNGEALSYTATGNFLANLERVPDIRFAHELGNSGGEDTEYFLRLKDNGLRMYWCSSAIVYEDIPLQKATTQYMLTRFITQGRTYRNILEGRGEIALPWLFSLRALFVFLVSLPISLLFMFTWPSVASWSIKRGFTNLGKLIDIGRPLYK